MAQGRGQALIVDIPVTLAPGGTYSYAHGLFTPSGPCRPSSVLPDRSTPLVCDAADLSRCYFSNPSSDAASAIFRCRKYYSLEDYGVEPLLWHGASSSGGGGVNVS